MYIIIRIYLIFIVIFVLNSYSLLGQTVDTSNKVSINIINTENIIFLKTDSGEFYRFIGNVILQQGSDTLYCDSVHQNKATKNFEAFSNVIIKQVDGTTAKSEYLKYTSAKRQAYLEKNVVLTDGKNKMVCNELNYDLGIKEAVYNNWGMLKNDTTTITSKEGIYNVSSKEARFKEKVVVDDIRYKITSEDLLYNSETKIITFLAPSIVKGDSGNSSLQTSKGTYDSRTGVANFSSHSSIINGNNYLEGDSLYYNKITGYGFAQGHVISIDTSRHSTLFCGEMEYFRFKRITWARIKPVLRQVSGKDTLYMRADTFYSYPTPKFKLKNTDTVKRDSIYKVNKIGTNKGSAKSKKLKKLEVKLTSIYITDTIKVDSNNVDTTSPLLFIGYHHVKIFSDSMQAKCDSVAYSQADSTIRLIFSPIAWSHQGQITGDTILLKLDDSNKLKTIFVPNNALLVSQSGPTQAKLFDQVQGKTLTAYFENNNLYKIVVVPNAESIYFSKDDHGAYIGESEATSDRMKIYFKEQQIYKILFEKDVHQKVTPLDKTDLKEAHLSRFKWLISQKPKSKEELFK